MTKDEFKLIIAMLTAAYPNFEISNKIAFDMWYESLKDIDLKTAKLAVMKQVTESVYRPTIASLRQMAINIKNPMTTIMGAEAWGEITNAIKKYGLYRESEALESMTKETAELVKRFGFKNLCLSENQMVDRAHFIKAFDKTREENGKAALIAPAVSQAIENNRRKLKQLTAQVGRGLNDD